MFDPNLAFRPVVSVCILSHTPEYTAEAEASIRAQTLFASGEVEICKKECPTYWGNKINEVIQAASGEFIVPLCYDDRLKPDALEKMVAVMQVLSKPPKRVDFVYSDIWLFGGPDGDRVMELPEWHPHEPTQRCVPWVTAMYRRELFDDVLLDRRGYDPTLQYWDWDWSKRLGLTEKVGVRIPEPLFEAREHPANGHKRMHHGLAFMQLWLKHDRLRGPQPWEPEVLYKPWYEGRSPLMTEDDLERSPWMTG